MLLPFTKDDVLAAYAAHPDIKPCRSQFATKDEDGVITGCCGLSILLYHAGHVDDVADLAEHQSVGPAIDTMIDRMQWSADEVERWRLKEHLRAFIFGFDIASWSNINTLDRGGPEEIGALAYREANQLYNNG